MTDLDTCPQAHLHTPGPQAYLEWHATCQHPVQHHDDQANGCILDLCNCTWSPT